MRRLSSVVLLLALAAAGAAAEGAQSSTTKKPPPKPPAKTAKTAPPKLTTAPANITCPYLLGVGVGSQRQFCDVMTGRNPADGVLVHLPPHKGTLTLSFDLHNRHTYSAEAVKQGKAYASYTATIGALTMEGDLLGRGVVQSEFRSVKDLLDRVGGGAGPGGVKAVAPIGNERILIDVPQDVTVVSLLGERLTVVTRDGTETFTAAGRPIADISNVTVEYQPAKPAKTPAKKPPAKKKK
jgi:hypothetical protein